MPASARQSREGLQFRATSSLVGLESTPRGHRLVASHLPFYCTLRAQRSTNARALDLQRQEVGTWGKLAIGRKYPRVACLADGTAPHWTMADHSPPNSAGATCAWLQPTCSAAQVLGLECAELGAFPGDWAAIGSRRLPPRPFWGSFVFPSFCSEAEGGEEGSLQHAHMRPADAVRQEPQGGTRQSARRRRNEISRPAVGVVCGPADGRGMTPPYSRLVTTSIHLRLPSSQIDMPVPSLRRRSQCNPQAMSAVDVYDSPVARGPGSALGARQIVETQCCATAERGVSQSRSQDRPIQFCTLRSAP